ncbi:Peptidoglycan-binding Lysin subgroup [Penicillium brevicompactum]|uniref:uncharacterized protein n=1 Tax=Penicillium brevicompactum TaxID=5074 RepID=UPI0025406D14|nr:uncharacterized protein N7506_010880 [Penicillium brevicompactum]KAJ5321750.1 hypothetical protein N7506_010880 [Penicillium brevicompactum]
MINLQFFALSVILASAAAVPTPTDGFCASYIIQGYDTCALIAQAHGITEADIEAFNVNTWAWLGCNQLYQGDFICLSAGNPPMPMALPNAVCGPQVPGTVRPSNWADLGTINPCSDNRCCATWGQCGTGADYCDAKARKPPAGVTATVSAATEVEPQAPTAQAKNAAATTEAKSAETKADAKTTSKKTSTTKSATSTSSKDNSKPTADAEWIGPLEADGSYNEPWEVTWYSEKDCTGDYYHLSGYNGEVEKGKKLPCQSISDTINTDYTETNVTCKWWTGGGMSWAPCKEGTMKSPKSWVLEHAFCTVYSLYNCDCFDHYANLYTSDGCHNKDKFDTPKFESFQCEHVRGD